MAVRFSENLRHHSIVLFSSTVFIFRSHLFLDLLLLMIGEINWDKYLQWEKTNQIIIRNKNSIIIQVFKREDFFSSI